MVPFFAYKSNLIAIGVSIIDNSADFVFAKVQITGSPDLYIGWFYQHYNSDCISLCALFNNITYVTKGKKFPNLIIAGDFNLPSTDWEWSAMNTPSRYGAEIKQLGLEIMDDLFLNQLVTKPTRGNTILDLLFSSRPALVQNINVCPGINDHSDIMAEILLKATTTKQPARKVFMCAQADPSELKKELSSLRDNFLSTSTSRDVNSNWDYFADGLFKIIKKLVQSRLSIQDKISHG